MQTMEPLTIALIVLVVVAVWAVVELALTIRKTRGTIDTLAESVNTTIEEVQPVIAKLDGIADEFAPASKQVEPLITKAQTAVDAVSIDLLRLDGILGDVSTVTGTASNATNAVNAVVGSAANAATGLINRIGGGKEPEKPSARIAGGDQDDTNPDVPVDPTPAKPTESEAKAADGGYFTYPSASEADDKADADDATDKTE